MSNSKLEWGYVQPTQKPPQKQTLAILICLVETWWGPPQPPLHPYSVVDPSAFQILFGWVGIFGWYPLFKSECVSVVVSVCERESVRKCASFEKRGEGEWVKRRVLVYVGGLC